MVQEEQNLSKEQKKIEIAYKKALQNAKAILKGKKFKPVSQLEASELENVMASFFEEERKDKIKEFQGKFKKVLVAKVEFDKFVKQQEVEFKQAVFIKKKEFTLKINECLALVSGIDALASEFAKTLEADNDN